LPKKPELDGSFAAAAMRENLDDEDVLLVCLTW
jgi:hypothetical protein